MSMCDNCIHDDVCGLEDNHEEAITFCANMIPKDILDKIKADIKEVINVNKVIGSNNSKAQNIGLMWVLEIIDKCIEAGEEK